MADQKKRGKFDRTDSMASHTDRLIAMLDQVEKRVETLREHAIAMEQEKDHLLETIDQFRNMKELDFVSSGEREELFITVDRLLCRCLTVDVKVSTIRNEVQQQALDRINRMLQDLSEKSKSDLVGCKELVVMYLNACSSDSSGIPDQKFQMTVIECTVDDQKKIRKRLHDYLQVLNNTEEELSKHKISVS
ncbi:BAG family molecular chaperone regulator 2-like [Saccoglossus kowalevskii]|uniref:BAG family molecular chaperone regulator 2-like n=1 Tax=Saccoglossus kowalevskii TaxID=10224 RepID=A0ABM0GM15_SACKO|nr:PREDICTED: BAG family molecular chaperone regulator 2-like [Saccoglossus kowalevskii]